MDDMNRKTLWYCKVNMINLPEFWDYKQIGAGQLNTYGGSHIA